MDHGIKHILTIALTLLSSGIIAAQEGPQLYNMSFDAWSKHSGAWYPYPKGASKAQKVWDSANKGLSVIGVNCTVPEYKHLAVEGEGKAAARISSVKVMWAFVAGNLFTGTFNKVVDFSGADMDMGVPFTGRPKSISGYYHYIPKRINFAKAPYEKLKGSLDKGRIEVILTDWSKPYHVDTTQEEFIDGAADPHVIGRAFLIIDRATDGYVHFEIPFEYRNGKKPGYIVINAASSLYGAWFTGASGSVLYLDELKFNY